MTEELDPYLKTACEFAALMVEDYLYGDCKTSNEARAFIFGPQEGWVLSFQDCCAFLAIDFRQAQKSLRERRNEKRKSS